MKQKTRTNEKWETQHVHDNQRYFYAKMDLPPHQFFSGPENDFHISYEKGMILEMDYECH